MVAEGVASAIEIAKPRERRNEVGYWESSREGASFANGVKNASGDEAFLWGDAPADIIDDATDRLMTRLTTELGRFPTVDEIDLQKYIFPSAEIQAAKQEVERVFLSDIGRLPSPDEVIAGMRFSDTETALMFFKQRNARESR